MTESEALRFAVDWLRALPASRSFAERRAAAVETLAEMLRQAEQDERSEAEFMSTCARECRCCRECGAQVPCPGVTAGGLCDEMCFCGLGGLELDDDREEDDDG